MSLDLNSIQQAALPNFRFGDGTIGSVVAAALPYIFFFAGLALLIYIILGGYRLMFSQGDPKAIAEGKSKVTSALIGFIIIFTAFWIVQLAGSVLGLNQLQLIFGGSQTSSTQQIDRCAQGRGC